MQLQAVNVYLISKEFTRNIIVKISNSLSQSCNIGLYSVFICFFIVTSIMLSNLTASFTITFTTKNRIQQNPWQIG